MKKKLNELESGGIWHRFGFPDDGTGISTDDDRPPGNILIGVKYKEIPFFNRLTTFTRNWDMDAGNWKWDHFEHAGGMEDYDNYSQTLQSMKHLFPKETWDQIWKRMSQVSDKESKAAFAAAGQPHRDASTQLGKDAEVVAIPPKEVQLESLIKKIELFTL